MSCFGTRTLLFPSPAAPNYFRLAICKSSTPTTRPLARRQWARIRCEDAAHRLNRIWRTNKKTRASFFVHLYPPFPLCPLFLTISTLFSSIHLFYFGLSYPPFLLWSLVSTFSTLVSNIHLFHFGLSYPHLPLWSLVSTFSTMVSSIHLFHFGLSYPPFPLWSLVSIFSTLVSGIHLFHFGLPYPQFPDTKREMHWVS